MVLIAIGGAGILKARRIKAERNRLVEASAKGPIVLVTSATQSPPDREVTLIGESRPYFETTLYAKVAGYLKEMKVDKGDWVKEGDRVAVIESPETDQAYVSALADDHNKSRIAARYKVLRAKKLVSQQEADQTYDNANMARAVLETQRALRGYEIVTAPFSGKVTSRYTDPGALIQNAEGSQTSSQALVTVSDIRHLRIYAYVDQRDATQVHPGIPAVISLNERPDLKVDATVTRTADQLDYRTRTLLTEIDIDNSKLEIVSGSFVQVTFKLPNPPAVVVPSRALVIQNSKPYVAVVDESSEVHYRPIKLERDDGESLHISDGLKEGEKVAVSLGNTAVDGQKIQPRESQMAGQAKSQ